MTQRKDKAEAIKLEVQQIPKADCLAIDMADLIRHMILNADTVGKNVLFKIINGSPKLEFTEFKAKEDQDSHLILQSYGRFGAMNITFYNPEENIYNGSIFFESLNAGNIGVIAYNDTSKHGLTDDISKGFRKAFGDITGLEIVKVMNEKAKTSKPDAKKAVSSYF